MREMQQDFGTRSGKKKIIAPYFSPHFFFGLIEDKISILFFPILRAQQHAEHEGKPYCNNPCYSALFGPGGKRSSYLKRETPPRLKVIQQ